MNISTENIAPESVILRLEGRLDAFGAESLIAETTTIPADVRQVLIDMQQVPYISSAGLRAFLTLHQRLRARDGALSLFGLQEYCAQVLDMAGFSEALTVFTTEADALRSADGSGVEESQVGGGRFRWCQQREAHGTIDVMGDINDVLYARVTEKHIASKPFFETEYALGLGALGHKPEDYLPIMGEAMMIGGTMVWLPTDGHDTPDFLIPKKASTKVTLRTGFNVCVRGGFNEIARFESDRPEGITVSALYRALFDLAKTRRPDFKGALGLALRAETATGFGAGVTRSPILDFQPDNGKMIIAPENFAAWFEIDKEPRHGHTTALICGAGVDLTMDLSGYDAMYLNRSFYINPANSPSHQVLLHNHAVFFKPLPLRDDVSDLESEIERVVDQGEFVDMRHLLDQTTITRAIIGINYVQAFQPDEQT